MSSSVSNILIVLASPIDQSDQRLNQINKYCKSFAQICTNNGINVDILDLYSDTEARITDYLETDNSKVLEYQIRVTKADEIFFFHPVLLDGVPSILKGFLENVFCPGFGFKIEKQLKIGLLDIKATVFAFDDKSQWSAKVLMGNQLENFWNKSVFDLTGLKGKINIFYKFRTVSTDAIAKFKIQIDKVAERINTKSKQLDA
jgi:putative NADPH-quinone reductase